MSPSENLGEKYKKVDLLTKRAKKIADAMEHDPAEAGAIAYEMNNREVLAAGGFSSLREWGQRIFGKRWKNVEASMRIHERLVVAAGLKKNDIIAMGRVKAYELARLPESELRKEEWIEAAKNSDTSTFKRRVRDFFDNSPDHKEAFCRIGFDSPKSFRDVWKRVIKAGMLHEGTEQVFEVVEAMTAGYEIELQNADSENAGEDAATTEAIEAAGTTEG